MAAARLYRGDRVLHPHYDGTWKIWGNHPRSGWVWLEPIDHIAKAVSLWTEHGMLGAQRSQLEAVTYEGAHHGIC